ncbi:MAG: acetate--CoA ligase family protein, partial [Pseudoxanthomonas sp.]
MSTYRLDAVFRPKSIAIVGGSPRERSAGRAVVRNLRAGGFAGTLWWVARHAAIDGIATHRDLAELPGVPELVVVTTPAASVPKIIAGAARLGVQAAIVLTANLGHGPGSLAEQAAGAARAHGLRILGPHCLGVIAPHAGLNASIAAHMPAAGDLALVSESSAIAAALVEWGVAREVGFSAVVSLGDGLDVDFGDLLDHFATDYRTRAILLYVERIGDARKFMSAARAAARAKPVVVVKSGRERDPHPSPLGTHAQALAAPDAVYGAAFRRAGLLRVGALDELFAAAQTLGRIGSFPGHRLAILSNGGGVGLLARDRLLALHGTLAPLAAATIERLDRVLPQGWSRANPVDIVVDADGERYGAAIEALLADEASDALLVVNVPTAFTSSADAARALTAAVRQQPRGLRGKPVFAVWLGQDGQAATILNDARIPGYATEADGVDGFMHLVRYRQAQSALMETPPSLPDDFAVDAGTARAIVEAALAEGRQWLDPAQTVAVLRAYGIDAPPVAVAADARAAVEAARPLLEAGQPVALKVLSPDIPHKSDIDGVRLGLASADAVHLAAQALLERAHQLRPDARIDGLLVQPTVLRGKARELFAGIADDATFGPVIVFGRGGTAVEVINDRELALPPLDLRLAHELIARTRASRILKAYGDMPAVDER